MTRLAEPDLVACPTCKSYFYRKRLKSFSGHYEVCYSDGGTRSGYRQIVPELGRCVCCRFIIENIEELEAFVLPEVRLSAWEKVKNYLRPWLLKSSKHSLNESLIGCAYLPNPTFQEYAELFTISTDHDKKRVRAVQACRAFHQQFCVEYEERPVSFGTKPYAEPTKAQQKQYDAMTDFILNYVSDPIVDEYILFCADLLRIRGDFAGALEKYESIEGDRFADIVVQGKQWCAHRNKLLMRLLRR